MQSAFRLDLFSFEFGEDLVPERIAAFAQQLELSLSGDQNEPLMLALGAGVETLLHNSSRDSHDLNS
jgi:hypothetical protein